jgi:hypothetical protein
MANMTTHARKRTNCELHRHGTPTQRVEVGNEAESQTLEPDECNPSTWLSVRLCTV